MKNFAITLLLSSLIFSACLNLNSGSEEQEDPVLPTVGEEVEEPAKGYDVISQSIEGMMEVETTTLLDVNGEPAYPYHTFTFSPEFHSIWAEEYTGTETFIFEDGNKVEFMVNYEYDYPQLSVRVNDEYMTTHDVPNGYVGEFFAYTFIFPNTEEFYAFDGGGHEGIATHHYFNGQYLTDYNEGMKAILGDEFKTDWYFPPFSIYVTDSYLKVIEERYCCDTTFDTEDEDRMKYKKFFLFDRENMEIIEEGKFER